MYRLTITLEKELVEELNALLAEKKEQAETYEEKRACSLSAYMRQLLREHLADMKE